MRIVDLERSIYLRALNDLYELLDKFCLEPNEKGETLKYNDILEIKVGINRFMELITLISKKNPDNKFYVTPYIIYKEGNC